MNALICRTSLHHSFRVWGEAVIGLALVLLLSCQLFQLVGRTAASVNHLLEVSAATVQHYEQQIHKHPTLPIKPH
jgi:hypothetical protein